MNSVKVMEAYGETHDAKEWARILGCSETTVYKHMRSPEWFEDWMYRYIGCSRAWAEDNYPGLSVAELVDRNACHNLGWKLVDLMNEWEKLKILLARDEAVLNVDGDIEQVLEWLEFRWNANNGVWSKVILAEGKDR